MQHLHRGGAAEVNVLGGIHYAHAARTNLVQDTIAADYLSRLEHRSVSSRGHAAETEDAMI